jgi:hypothetical protein
MKDIICGKMSTINHQKAFILLKIEMIEFTVQTKLLSLELIC